MMKRILYYLPSIIFNVTEVLAVIYIGRLLNLEIKNIIIVIILFAGLRMLLKEPLHYRDWKRCFAMTLVFFVGIFITFRIDIIIGIGMTILGAIVLTGKGNINDIFMWGGNKLNQEVYNWVKYNQDNEKLKNYENQLKENDKQKYYIFRYRFREFKSYNTISKLMEMDNQRISDEIKIMSHFIEYSIRLD